jgi:hypothetical protein
MTITNGYCTLVEWKAFYTVRGGSAGTDAADDTVIEGLIEAVSRWIELGPQCNRFFWKEGTDSTRYFETEKGDEVKVTDMSTTPTTVSVDYSGVRTYTDLVSADWEVDPVNAALENKPYTRICISPARSAYFPTGRRGVKVATKFGWPAVPADIKEICEEIVMNIYDSRSGQSSAGNISVTAAGVVIRPQDVPARAQAIFANYRSPL